ncbi:MAG: response regulator [Desulfurivibrionaceae bacterium]|nr:response regulator [Desulfurivibrionaceae bacterium]
MFSVAPDVPDRLVGDSTRLGQILINLTANAIKFTKAGEVILDIALRERSGESLTLRFSVRDTGLGLTEEQIDNLFTPFTQADGSISRNYGGTGLGLAISKRLVDLMGGDLEVQSRPGQGSTFSFTAVLAAQPQLPEPDHAGVDLRGLRVLVVEDHPATREILHKALESFSFQVTAVESGEKGLEEFRGAAKTEHPFDLLLLDYRLSGISGDIVARAVREMLPPGGQPKILLLTSVGAWKIVERCLEAGCDSVMDKPVSRAGLFDAITRLFDKDHSACDALPEKKALHRRIAGARVLVVEDNEINQQVATEILQRAGVLVDLADNGEEAVEAVLTKEYDLVLMDIQMPGMDGLEATRVIRASGIKRLSDLPIVAMTANAIKGDEALSLAAGMNDHITKPIDPKVLFAALEKWLPQNAQPAAAATAQETSPVGPEDLPQRIPGIDLELALKRLGSTELCKGVLRQFVEHYSGGADTILEQIRNRQWDEACRALHSLKGVAGAICAQELYAITVDLEKNCKVEQAPLDLLAAFKEEHDTLIENLQPFRASAFVSTLSVPPSGQEPGSLRLRKILVSMLPDIEAHRPVKCGAHLAELKKITWPAERQVEMEALITAVENYQFKQAGQLAGQLIKLFNPEGKQ